MTTGFDPAQLTGAFLSGRQLSADQIDTSLDLIPIFHWDAAHNRYIECKVSPDDLYAAMVANA